MSSPAGSSSAGPASEPNRWAVLALLGVCQVLFSFANLDLLLNKQDFDAAVARWRTLPSDDGATYDREISIHIASQWWQFAAVVIAPVIGALLGVLIVPKTMADVFSP